MYRVFFFVTLLLIHSMNILAMEPPCPLDVQGTRCDFRCVPPTKSDHYKCSPSGQKICDYGWRGHNCHMPICTRRCENGGLCVGPNLCSCRVGWRGPTCELCDTRPGCVNGDCRRPFDCLCRWGWKGWNCEQMVDVCRMKDPCQNGAKCIAKNAFQESFICVCAPGFGGINCSLRIAPLPINESSSSSPRPPRLELQASTNTTSTSSTRSATTTTIAAMTTTVAAMIDVNVTRQSTPQLNQKPKSTTSQIEILVAACVILLFLIFVFLSCSTIINLFKHYCNCKNNNQPNGVDHMRSADYYHPCSNNNERRYTVKDSRSFYCDSPSSTLALSPSSSKIISSTISTSRTQSPLEKIIVIQSPSPPSSPPPAYALL